MASLKTLTLAVAGLTASATVYSQNYSPNQIGMAMMRLNAASLDHGKSDVASGSIWAKIRKDFRMDEVNPELVRRHEAKFAANSAYFNRTVSRSKPYMYHIFKEVEKRNMPAEIALLPFIESAYVVKAKSHVGASGLWQFMPATGRHYGLEQTPMYDGRHDVAASTDAALNYLQYLHGLFGDWSLALAAYNWGEGNVSRAVNRARAQGLDPVYENLRMPAETRNYVPKLMAVRNIVSNPQYFGMNLDEIDNKPYFKAVNLDQPIDISAAVSLAGISEDEFRALNPAFKQSVFIPNSSRKMLLPVAAVNTFEQNYRKADPTTLLTWNRSNTVTSPASGSVQSDLASLDRDPNPQHNRLQTVEPMPVLAVNNAAARSYAAAPQIVPPQTRVATVAPAPQASDFVQVANRAPAEAVAIKADNKPAVMAINQPLPLPTQPYQKPAEPVATVAQTAPAATPVTVATAEAKPEVASTSPANVAVAQVSPAAPTTTEAPISVAEVQPEPAVVAQTAAPSTARSAAAPLAVAQAEAPATLPVAIEQPITGVDQLAANEGADDLQNLVENNNMRSSAATAVREALARADMEEARAAKAAAARAKQQQRTEERLARANTQRQNLAASTHRVTDGDTLYNISQRYGVSVADLVAQNQIQGNNIRKGQVLNVVAAKSRNSGGTQQVSYTVRKGDTLTNIANRFNLSVNDIRRWNGNTAVITPGQRIKLIGL